MSYRYQFSSPIKNIEECNWFDRSYESIEDWDHRDVDDVDRDYEKRFNVKLIYDKVDKETDVRPILAVEFPSEAEATLFFLRWS